MFMSKLNDWLNLVDPYAIQRVVLYKALVIATIMVLAYWFFRPVNYTAYVLPTITVCIYELPFFSRLKQKEQALLFNFGAMIICSVSFYLFFPYRLFFLFYAILFLAALYFLALKMLPSIKFCSLLTISSSALFVTTEPHGDRQIAYDIFCSNILSMSLLYLSLKCLRRFYLINWLYAQKKLIRSLEDEIGFTTDDKDVSFFLAEVNHINIIYAYRGLIAKKYLIHVYRMSHNIRNIQFALSNLYGHEKNDAFWLNIKNNLETLRQQMELKKPYPWPQNRSLSANKLQQLTLNYFDKAIRAWNTLCGML